MARPRIVDALLNVALVGVLVLVGVLLYGLVTRTSTPRTTPTRDASVLSAPGADPIQVEVRNAAGADGIARATTAYLRRRGFDVIEMGNATGQREATVVVVRAGTDAYARRVAAALDLPADRVEAGGPLADYDPDVAVFLGADYARLAPFQDALPDSTD
ncbi:MAG: LytR C-terminal domain-containing protein [Bacteroidota bacterium]